MVIVPLFRILYRGSSKPIPQLLEITGAKAFKLDCLERIITVQSCFLSGVDIVQESLSKLAVKTQELFYLYYESRKITKGR